MPKAQPIIGYPSKTQACQALRAQGLTYNQIAEKLGIDPKSVAGLIANDKSRARIGNLKTYLKPTHIKWLEEFTPKGMTFAEYLVEGILDEIVREE